MPTSILAGKMVQKYRGDKEGGLVVMASTNNARAVGVGSRGGESVEKLGVIKLKGFEGLANYTGKGEVAVFSVGIGV